MATKSGKPNAPLTRQHLLDRKVRGCLLAVGAASVSYLAKVANSNLALLCHQRLLAPKTCAATGEATLDEVGIDVLAVRQDAKDYSVSEEHAQVLWSVEVPSS